MPSFVSAALEIRTSKDTSSVLGRLEGQPLSRLLSLLLVLAYVGGAGMTVGPVSALKILGAMLVPLACVWFPEEMGALTGHRYSLTRPSHPSFVWLLGWFLLLLPLTIATVFWLQGIPLDGLL
jgi:hypothetical protein